MLAESDVTRLLFGLKVRQLRLDRGVAAVEVARLAGLSPSYLNEIEKGKKYPRVEKMHELARALGTDYETLVSPRLSKRLAPLSALLQSRVLNELPLAWLGLDVAQLFERLWDAPAQVSAFVNTVIEISRKNGLTVESFFFSVLRTYQEIHDNYFSELEQAADDLRARLALPPEAPLTADHLTHCLTAQFGYQLDYYDSARFPDFAHLRSLFFPAGHRFLVNAALTPPQRAFTFARELAYQHLGLAQRPLVSSVMEAESFAQVLNNFRASYVAGALLMPRAALVARLEAFFALPTWQPAALGSILSHFGATPETFLQRTSGLLATHFGLSDLFMLRHNQRAGEASYRLTKEMHLARLHAPHYLAGEHACRRWPAPALLNELAQRQRDGTWDGTPLIGAQVARYHQSPDAYLVLAIATNSPPRVAASGCVTLGIALSERLRRVIRFADDPAVAHRVVNQTCERCSLAECQERAAPPRVLHQQDQLARVLTQYQRIDAGASAV